MIIACLTAGLANRVHALAACIRLSRLLNRRLVAWWPVNTHLAAGYRDLFQAPEVELATQETIDDALLMETLTKVYNHNEESINIEPKDPHYKVIVKCFGSARIAGENSEQALAEEKQIARSFRPVGGIIEAAKELLAKAERPIIGVHIRTCDIIGVHMNKHLPVEKRLAGFSNGAAGFIRELAGAFINDGRGSIFVCSDDPEQERAVMDAFPGRVVRQEKSDDWRTNASGMREAVFDLYALSMADSILGTANSQFSELAARLGAIPLKTIK